MFVKVINEQTKIYPYTIGMLRKDNPNTSFPKKITDELLTEYNVYRVKMLEPLEHNITTQTIIQETLPTFVDESWVLGWTINEKTQEQINQETESKITSIRLQRNGLLSQCDWTQLIDAPLTDTEKSEWAVYRQALRDITAQPNFPENISWPTEPGVNL
jgi:hypothetical protein